MSGQAKRSRVRAAQRHRRAVARELAAAIPGTITTSDLGPTGNWNMHGERIATLGERRVTILLDGRGTFDVHAAREHARGLVALADEQTVFEHWTQTKGLGPDNREPGAFCECGHGDAPPGERWFVSSFMPRTDWARLRHGGRYIGRHGFGLPGIFWWRYECTRCHGKPGGWPGDLAREWAALGHDRRAPMGRSLARLGQRILDMLEGQPSECSTCHGWGRPSIEARQEQARRGPNPPLVDDLLRPCGDCQGTGHNLRGVLSPLEWSPAVRRKVCDGAAMLSRAQHVARDLHARTWTRQLNRDWERWREGLPGYGVYQGVDGRTMRTRVCPRGEHRHTGTRDPEHDLDRRISERGWDTWGDEHKTKALGEGVHGPRELVTDFDSRPRWYLGEIEHQRKRHPHLQLATGERLDEIGAEAGRPRRPGETDADYRARLMALVMDRARPGSRDAIRAAVLTMFGVDECTVDDATTDTVIPPHTIRVSYEGTALPGSVIDVVREWAPAGAWFEVNANWRSPAEPRSIVFETTVGPE